MKRCRIFVLHVRLQNLNLGKYERQNHAAVDILKFQKHSRNLKKVFILMWDGEGNSERQNCARRERGWTVRTQGRKRGRANREPRAQERAGQQEASGVRGEERAVCEAQCNHPPGV